MRTTCTSSTSACGVKPRRPTSPPPRARVGAAHDARDQRGWLAAIQTLAPPPRVGAERRDASASSDGVGWRADDRAQLTHVLASLVLSCVQEVVRQ